MRQIIAIGGGGFSESDNPLLDGYILKNRITKRGSKQLRHCILRFYAG